MSYRSDCKCWLLSANSCVDNCKMRFFLLSRKFTLQLNQETNSFQAHLPLLVLKGQFTCCVPVCLQDSPPSTAWGGTKAVGETQPIPNFPTPTRHLQVEHYQLHLWLSQLFEYSPSPEFGSLWISLSPPPKHKGWTWASTDHKKGIDPGAKEESWFSPSAYTNATSFPKVLLLHNGSQKLLSLRKFPFGESWPNFQVIANQK